MLVGNGALVVTAIELLEIKFSTGSFAGPETQIVGGRSVETRNWDIIGNRLDNLTTLPGARLLALRILEFSDMAVELNLRLLASLFLTAVSWTYIYNDIMSGKLPRIEIKPVIGYLDLVSINNFLLENTIAVSQTITPSRVIEGRQGVQEASSQSTQTTISKRSIMLLVDNVFDTETEILKTTCKLC